MTEKARENARVSLEKPATAPSGPVAPGPAVPQERPRQVVWVVGALVLSGVLALAAGLALFGLHSFILSQFETSNRKLAKSDRRTHAQLLQAAHQQPIAVMVQTAVFFVVLLFVARAVWRGRYWSRWAVVGVWLLATVTGIFGGAPGLLYIGQDAPVALKVPVALSALVFIVAAAVAAFVKPFYGWLNLSRPERPAAGAASARRSMFAPREPARPTGQDVTRADANTDRARAKQRMNAETVLRSDVDQRARSRGSKSRRSGS